MAQNTRRLVVIGIVGVAVVVVALATAMGVFKQDSKFITIPTGPSSGVYYPLGASLANLWNDQIKDYQFSSHGSNGSVHNIQLLKGNEAEVALSLSSVATAAYRGTGAFEGNKFDQVRIIGALYPGINHVVATGNIQSIKEMVGKRIVAGDTGSATARDFELMVRAYGLTLEKDFSTDYVGFTAAVQQLTDGIAVGANFNAGVPNAAVEQLSATGKANLISIDDNVIDKIIADAPWYYRYTLPGDAYPKMTGPVVTLAQPNVLVTRADMPADTVYQLTKTFWENLNRLGQSVPAVLGSNLENAMSGIGDVPIHEGALRYYREKGLSK